MIAADKLLGFTHQDLVPRNIMVHVKNVPDDLWLLDDLPSTAELQVYLLDFDYSSLSMHWLPPPGSDSWPAYMNPKGGKAFRTGTCTSGEISGQPYVNETVFYWAPPGGTLSLYPRSTCLDFELCRVISPMLHKIICQASGRYDISRLPQDRLGLQSTLLDVKYLVLLHMLMTGEPGTLDCATPDECLNQL